MVAMRTAWGAAFVAAIIGLFGGVIALIRGEWLTSAVLIFMAPVGCGQHVALGMAIDYARGSGWGSSNQP